MNKRSIRIAMAAWAAALLAVSAAPIPAQAAAPAHIFDAAHSLTGGCTVSEADPVPDPPRVEGPQEQEVAECEAGSHPSESFVRPRGIAVDSYGNVYVAVPGPEGAEKNRVDFFNPKGLFLGEVTLPGPVEVQTVAVDGEGHLYVYLETASVSRLERFDPDSGYDPTAGVIAYSGLPTPIDETGSVYASLAVNPKNDHLFVNFGCSCGRPREAIVEFGSAAEGNPLLDNAVAEVSGSGVSSAGGLAIDAATGRLYATDQEPETTTPWGMEIGHRLIRVFNLAAPHELIETFDGSSTPEGTFVRCNGIHPESCSRWLTIAVDEATGHLFAYDQERLKEIYELSETGQYLASIDHDLRPLRSQQVAVDNGEHSPNRGYVWATDNPPGIGHAYAFSPTEVGPAEIESVAFSEVAEGEALLEASVASNQAETSYSFEFTSKEQFEASGFSGARIAGQGTIPAAKLPATVSAEATGLAPGTSYVFRVVAENEAGGDEGTGEFSTYPAYQQEPCPNDALRRGPSASLPDCRAYELVTPPDTGARAPQGLISSAERRPFPTLPASPSGDRVSFTIENGLIPGLEATGSLSGDPYLSSRGASGWSTEAVGGNGTEAVQAASGGRSPDQTYSAWVAEGEGSAVLGGQTVYLRYPDGHSEPLGKGSLGVDPGAHPLLISEGGRHVIFTSSMHLEPAAPEAGNPAVYDRDAQGATQVASLLPGGGTPTGKISYQGSSLDGRGIAFEVKDEVTGRRTLYLRRDDQATYEIGQELTFEGVAEGGGRIFYLEGGNLEAFDAESGKTISFAGGGEVTVVNVSADGTTAFFVSPDKLTSSPNPLGAVASAGAENLYRSQEGSLSFIGSVSKRDVEGEAPGGNLENGLGMWLDAVRSADNVPGRFAADPSRSTEDGRTFLFQSDADITPYAAEGTRQVYRYASTGQLTCLSCNPTGAPPSGDATLQTVRDNSQKEAMNSPYDLVLNLSAGGGRAFFQSPDPLVAADTDRLQDVYEWEAQGVGSCTTAGGCVSLISSGRSEKTNLLYAASANGDDVFFRSSDRLVPADLEAVPSIYDARVGGGFPEPASEPGCEGEGCRPRLAPPPALLSPGNAAGKSGNVRAKRPCPKTKQRVKRHGKVRCVKKHPPRRHHRRDSGKAGKGGRK